MIELYTKVGSKAVMRPNPFIKFPAGEWHTNDEREDYIGHEILYISGTDPNEYIQGLLWEQLVGLADTSSVVIPYLPAARGDKGLPRDAAAYLKLVPYAHTTIVLDAHSPYLPKLIEMENVTNVVNVEAVDVFKHHNLNGWKGVVAPDDGAVYRAQKVAEYLDVPLYKATKTRDPKTGKLTGFDCEKIKPGGRLLIVDDICDGGGTFLGLAETLRRKGYFYQLDLYVSHGIFSQGLKKLGETFNQIYTTDSLVNRYDRHLGGPGNLIELEIKDYLLQLA